MAQINAIREEQNVQMGEIRICLEEIELSYQDDNKKRPRPNKRNEQELETNGEDCRGCGRGQDPDGWVMKSVKIYAPTFDGQIDPQVFSDWLLYPTFDGRIDPQR